MYFKSIKILASFLILLFALSSCANNPYSKKTKPFKHNTPLIQDKDIVQSGKSEIAKTLEMGPKPLEGDNRKLGKRKIISSITPIILKWSVDW